MWRMASSIRATSTRTNRLLISEFGWPKETIESDEFPALLAEASFESAATEYDTDEEYASFEDAARALGALIGVYVEGYLTNGKETKK